MARQIEPTPVLQGRDIERFERRIQADLQKPVSLKPTPKLEQARKMVLEHAVQAKK